MNGIILEESSMAVAAEKLVGDVSDSSSSKLILRKASETRYLTLLEGKERERELKGREPESNETRKKVMRMGWTWIPI